jgi:copper transport protein
MIDGRGWIALGRGAPGEGTMEQPDPIRCRDSVNPRRAAVNRGNAGVSGTSLFLAVLLVLAALLLTPPRVTEAHAFLRESDPAANAVLPTPPAEVTLRFTEPLEQSYSRADLHDQTGARLEGASFRFGADGYTLVVALPDGLANGTYSVLWRTLSTADGHTAQGYVPFTIGTDRDVAAVVPPAAEQVSSGAPEIVRAASRWFALMALAAVVAVWPVWLFVLRPAIGPAWQAGPALARRVRRFAAWAVALAVVANLVALAVQALATLAEGGFVGALRTTLFETRYGTLWLVRLGLLLLFAAALLGVGWWWPRRRPVAAASVLALAALLPLPFSLLAHAAAQPEDGRRRSPPTWRTSSAPRFGSAVSSSCLRRWRRR